VEPQQLFGGGLSADKVSKLLEFAVMLAKKFLEAKQ
jgi:hypothetical protein